MGMLGGKCLVLGATGFVGSHVTKQLVAQGNDVRALVRSLSRAESIEGVNLEIRVGNPFDEQTLRDAMVDVRYVFYCIVDPRSYLRDTAPLWKTNVEELKKVLEVMSSFDLDKFVFTSSLITIGINASGVSTEADAFNWADEAGEYGRCRVAGENLVMDYARDGRVPAVACCISNTFGAEDFQPTSHGKNFIIDVATGKMPVYINGRIECVGIKDSAQGMLAAAEHGRVGERYILSERYLTLQALFKIVAEYSGIKPPTRCVPDWLLSVAAKIGDVAAALLNRDVKLSSSSIKLTKFLPKLDHSKALRELGWEPRPVEVEIEEAVKWYKERRQFLRQKARQGA
jgi:dihydroflavonol-4-reductase